MKIFVVSDIHGSLTNLEKVLQLMQSVDQLWILGDILYHGPRNDLPKDYAPKKVIEVLNAIKEKIVAVRGNCDAEVDQMVLAFPILMDYQIHQFNHYKIFMTHGHHFDPDYLPVSHPLSSHDVFLYGHTHVLTIQQKDCVIINPGSISLPKENLPCSYGVLENDEFKIFDMQQKVLKSIQLNAIIDK